MKKLYLLLTITLAVFLSSCTTTIEPADDFELCERYPQHVDCQTDEPIDPVDPVDPVDPIDPVDPVTTYEDFLDIYYMNDFHGALLEDGDNLGMSKIANFITTRVNEYPNNSIVLAGGDMLQGSALSNYYSGMSTIDVMNEIGFDAFTLGNHEFDWGLETVTNYFDGDESNGEADFPLLGANVVYEGTTTLPDHIDPYTIIEKGDLKIGVIGTMGYGYESAIAESKIDGYEFLYPVNIIGDYATELRQDENCDIVIWVGHDSGRYNDEIKELTGDAKIDALFNAHSHSEYANIFSNEAPEMQSGATGEAVGFIRINLDENNEIVSYEGENFNDSSSALFWSEYQPVQSLIATYVDETSELFNAPIITAGEYLSKNDLSMWLCDVMRASTGAEIAFQNSGGTRATIDSGEVITMANLYEVWPFDNVVKTVYLDGSIINNLKGAGLVYSQDTGASFEAGTLYLVATNDYVFDKPENPFLDGTNPSYTGVILRDMVEQELLLQNVVFDVFLTSNEVQTNKED